VSIGDYDEQDPDKIRFVGSIHARGGFWMHLFPNAVELPLPAVWILTRSHAPGTDFDEYVAGRDPEDDFQFLITPVDARRLAQELNDAADEAETRAPPPGA
jgi:hypothetical protein